MVIKKPDEQLPDINLNPTDTKEFRQLGKFEDEVKLMFERMERVKPFSKDKVILLGMGSTRVECPFDCETWSVNMGYQQICQLDGHFSRIFLTHTQIRDVNGKEAFKWEQFNKLAEAGVIVYNIHNIKGLNSKMYPFKRISKKFNTEYFSNTISYMIAKALDEGYKKVSLYGCDMMTQSEYAWEKGGLEYWIGRLQQAGVDVFIAEGSTLLKTITGKPYGVKYFNMKDIDPTGTYRRMIKKYTPNATSDEYMFESPIKPPDPEPTNWVSVIV